MTKPCDSWCKLFMVVLADIHAGVGSSACRELVVLAVGTSLSKDITSEGFALENISYLIVFCVLASPGHVSKIPELQRNIFCHSYS